MTAVWQIPCVGYLPSQIDLTQPLVPQGPFDIIVHKLSDVIVEAERDSKSQQLLANFQVRLQNPSNMCPTPKKHTAVQKYTSVIKFMWPL